MALELDLHFAPYSDGGILPNNSIESIAGRTSQIYEEACAGELRLNVLSHNESEMPSQATLAHAIDLHLYARLLNGNTEYWGDPRPTGPQTKSISVIYADRYGPYQEALGVMFDRGFTTLDDGSDSARFTGTPREACAIFVGRLRDLRATDEELIQEAWFTTAHELGHVFNLTHTTHELTFLSPSMTERPFHDDEVAFNDDQTMWLQRCDISPYVWPGGSDFEDPGPTGHLNCARTFSQRSFPFGLDLVIDLEVREFQRYYPVELDISLKVASGITRRFHVPDTLDPGYDNFRIWIEEPNGSRRLYRSPRRYCSTGKRRYISPKAPFQRDISIFGEAGGYTFRVPGIHTLWCEFDVGNRGVLRSNQLEINILPSSLCGDDKVETLLTRAGVPQVLYHRVDPSKGKLLRHLNEACENLPKKSGVRSSLQYAMGRAWLSETVRGSRAKDETLRKAAIAQLTQALDSQNLGEHRLSKVLTLLDLAHQNDIENEHLVWCRD